MKKAIILTNKLGLSCAKLSYGKDGNLGETYQDFSVCTPGQVVSWVKYFGMSGDAVVGTRRFSPSRPFLIEGVLGSKNLFSESWSDRPITLRWTPFQTPSAIFWPSGGHFGFCMRSNVSHRRCAPIKQLIFRKLIGVTNNLWLDPFPCYWFAVFWNIVLLKTLTSRSVYIRFKKFPNPQIRD